ncbi:hypothetical protein QAD02_013230 [Eretmocerus hayati]|uniref:Uncharacterized protein n=1 Tax=Eretmocerus hayati TaxID=131215 RepID=A0ACC2P2V9_9HYME|nr:hypothetical protein QAD02_013230 [Eretmocerus hayati]
MSDLEGNCSVLSIASVLSDYGINDVGIDSFTEWLKETAQGQELKSSVAENDNIPDKSLSRFPTTISSDQIIVTGHKYNIEKSAVKNSVNCVDNQSDAERSGEMSLLCGFINETEYSLKVSNSDCDPNDPAVHSCPDREFNYRKDDNEKESLSMKVFDSSADAEQGNLPYNSNLSHRLFRELAYDFLKDWLKYINLSSSQRIIGMEKTGSVSSESKEYHR